MHEFFIANKVVVASDWRRLVLLFNLLLLVLLTQFIFILLQLSLLWHDHLIVGLSLEQIMNEPLHSIVSDHTLIGIITFTVTCRTEVLAMLQ